MQTHIRLSLEKKSTQGIHCLQFCQYLSFALFYSKTFWFIFCMITTMFKESITVDSYQNFGFNALCINLKTALTYTTLLTDELLN